MVSLTSPVNDVLNLSQKCQNVNALYNIYTKSTSSLGGAVCDTLLIGDLNGDEYGVGAICSVSFLG